MEEKVGKGLHVRWWWSTDES